MPLHLEPATPKDAAAVFALKKSVAEDLTRRFGKGHWSSFGTEKVAARDAATPGLWVARRRGRLIAMLRLAKRALRLMHQRSRQSLVPRKSELHRGPAARLSSRP